MTEDQAKTLFNQLFIAFPGYQNWLEKTDDPNATLAVWCKMLRSVSHGAGVQVVDRLIEGKLAMPKAYERDELPVLVKSYAARIDQDEGARRATEEARQSRQRAAGARRRDEYKLPLRKGLEQMRQIGHDRRDGKITQAQHDAEKRRIVQLAMERTEVVT